MKNSIKAKNTRTKPQFLCNLLFFYMEDLHDREDFSQTLQDELSQFALRIHVVGIDHGVHHIAMPKRHLNESNIFGLLIKLNCKSVSQ